MCVIDICSKYAWVFPLKDKKGVSIVNAFQKVAKQSRKDTNRRKYELTKKVSFTTILLKNG